MSGISCNADCVSLPKKCLLYAGVISYLGTINAKKSAHQQVLARQIRTSALETFCAEWTNIIDRKIPADIILLHSTSASNLFQKSFGPKWPSVISRQSCPWKIAVFRPAPRAPAVKFWFEQLFFFYRFVGWYNSLLTK